MSGRVVHVKDKVPGAVYIGRRMPGHIGSVFANPFKIGRDGNRQEVLEKYREYLRTNPVLRAHLPKLQGKVLACWCRHEGEPINPGNVCHGDVILEELFKLEHAAYCQSLKAQAAS